MQNNKPIYLIVHHTGGSNADPLNDSSNFTFKQCDLQHKNDPNINSQPPVKSSLGFYCAYHYYIEKDGALYQARADTEGGAHCKGYNFSSIGICLAGNFDATLPTDAQKKTLQKLLLQKSQQFGISIQNVLPHRRFASKTCFGRKLPDDWAQDLMRQPLDKDPVAAKKLLADLNSAMNLKDYKKAKDTCSYLFGELAKLTQI